MQKIMFNEQFGLQQATFDGIKTMTRRIVPYKVMKQVPAYKERYYAGALEPISVEDAIMQMCGPEHMFHVGYEVGEIVAVAQCYMSIAVEIGREDLSKNADRLRLWQKYVDMQKSSGYNNKMFVKAELMPRHIKITGKKVERLQAISDEDCMREGIIDTGSGYTCYRQGVLPLFRTPYAAFKALIDKLNRRGFFESNPLVFAYTYEMID